jgi:hypothetical protein
MDQRDQTDPDQPLPVSDDEYARRYAAELASTIEEWQRGTHRAEWNLAIPQRWAHVKDDAHGGRGGAWFGYARLVERRFGLSLKVMQLDGSWRPWSPFDLDPQRARRSA